MMEMKFLQTGRALILSDLHLNMLSGKFEEDQRSRVEAAIVREDPETVVLNGDNVDLFFGLKGGKQGADIETVLTENAEFVRLLRRVPKLFFLAGAHDQALRWDLRLCGVLRDCFPNCRGIYDGLVDTEAQIVVVPGVQWYYDNVVERDGRWMSLTQELTAAFEDFMLSGRLDAMTLDDLYVTGKLGFWYRTGSHYEFLQGMAKIFGCRISDYFERMAVLCRSPLFREWTEHQFYDEHRIVGRLARLQAEDGGPTLEGLAVPYWRMLGRVVKQRLIRYLDAGVLDYPPHTSIPFKTAVVGHTHIATEYSSPSGRRMLFTGSTKPQTRISGASCIAQNELGGGYVVIEREKARLEKFELEVWRTDLQTLAAELRAQERDSAVAV